jgi:hypothetical protein
MRVRTNRCDGMIYLAGKWVQAVINEVPEPVHEALGARG